MEEWKTITDYSNYEISNLGNVRSSKKTLKPCLLPKNKYELIQGLYTIKLTIWVNVGVFETKLFYIHQLVARAFIPNHDNLTIINHIDNNTTNNSSSNLQWISKEQYQIIKNERDITRQKWLKNNLHDVRSRGNFYGTTFGGSCFKTYT